MKPVSVILQNLQVMQRLPPQYSEHMDQPLLDKTLLILGVSSRIGSQAAFKWALEGASVIGIGSRLPDLIRIKREIDDIQGSFHYVETNLRDTHELQRVVAEISNKFNHLDGIINLIGEYGLTPMSQWETSLAQLIDQQHSSSDPLILTGNRGRAFYQAWIANYLQQTDRFPRSFPRSTVWLHIIDVICVGSSLEGELFQRFSETISMAKNTASNADQPEVSLIGDLRLPQHLKTRFTTVWVDSEEEAIAPGDVPGSGCLLWTDQLPDSLSPALIVDETIQLLTDSSRIGGTHILIQVRPTGIFRLALPSAVALTESHLHSGSTQPPDPPAHWIANRLNVCVKETDTGRGVFASQPFAPGELILQTTGRVLHHQTEHSIQINWQQHLEPDPPIRFINHSCEPNAGIKTNTDGLPDFYALKPISQGEEITFDYAMSEFSHQPRDNPAMEFDLTCCCGAVTCRGTLGYYSELPEAIKKTYEGFISSYLLSDS